MLWSWLKHYVTSYECLVYLYRDQLTSTVIMKLYAEIVQHLNLHWRRSIALFGPAVVRHVIDQRGKQDVSVQIAKQTLRVHISCVGSIVQASIYKTNLMHWGTGIISDIKVKQFSKVNRFMISVRGPQTRDLLLKQHGLNSMVIGDPALLAGDIYSNIIATTTTTTSVCFVIHTVYLAIAKERCPFFIHFRVNNYNHNVTQIFTNLALCQRGVSISLHGIIFSHAIDIPELPFVLGDCITRVNLKFTGYMHSIGITPSQELLPVWKHMYSNLTEHKYIEMVDVAEQPVFPIQTSHFYATFPFVDPIWKIKNIE